MADDNSSLAGLYAGAAQLASTGMQMAFNGAESRIGRDFAREMYARQRADSLADIQDARQYYRQMLADEREYNSSSAQVARLKAAGLNPSLAYGGQVTTAAPSGGFSSPTPQPSHPVSFPIAQIASPDFSGAYANFKRVQNESMLTKADVVLKAAQSLVLDQQTAGLMLDNIFKQSTLDDRVNLVSTSLQQANETLKQTTLVNAKYQQEIDAFPLQVEKLKAEIESINADTSLTENRRSKMIAETALTWQKNMTEQINQLGINIENDIKTQHLSQEEYKTQMQDVTYWVDTATSVVDSASGLIDSITGGVGKFFGGLFHRNKAKTVNYDSETRRMDAVTRRNQSLRPSSSSRDGARRRRSNKF